jgi:drug/metabolite transporter (DMT)-like permease
VKPRARHRAWTWIGAAALVAVLAAAVAAAVASAEDQPGRRAAIMFAAGVCLAGSLGGWLVGRLRPAVPARAVATGLAAVCLRFFPPLVAMAWLPVAGGRLHENGALHWVLVFYLALLATDILLHMIGPRADQRGGARTQN